MTDPLKIFDKKTKNWFKETLGVPTEVQRQAWPAIASGGHVLVSAPTGTGKTLSAFLVFIDRLLGEKRKGELPEELRLIYVSPLKSLAGDIRENLRRPLNGISDGGGLNVAIRTGDTPSKDRVKMTKKPPHILITTPESLYLLLSSVSGQKMLKTARAIIIDELHALIDTKRGAHMSLSMARLDRLCEKPLQRIGLSATIEPLELSTRYLSGNGQAQIIAPKMEKNFEINVVSPASDMRVLPDGTVWPEIAKSVLAECMEARSVIAFTEGRMYAEKLAFYVNELAGEGFARTHHGCVSKEQRAEAENDLRSGKLRLLCATSSMELGIDVGDIDRVVQIGCPKSISSVMQRLGRAGHNPGRVSVMKMFPRMTSENLTCGLTAYVASQGGIERSRPPRLCLDVLAQHLVSMASGDGYSVDGAMEILESAYPFRDVTREDLEGLLRMLAGDYEHSRDLPVRPRILYDRVNGIVEGDAYSRMLAVSAGGTIPDTGAFKVKGENGVRLGELDEEFVFEARVGDRFLLGSFAWRITRMDRDTVTVAPTSSAGAQPPFWRHSWLSRSLQTGLAFGALLRKITEAGSYDRIIPILYSLGLDKDAAHNSAQYILRQLDATGVLPDDRTIIAEHFSDDAGDDQLMIHSIFGREVNAPLSILLQEAARDMSYMDVSCFEDDDGILLMSGSGGFPEKSLLNIDPETARERLEALLPATPLFHMTFRYNAARALMMGVSKGKRQPLWVQRLRGAEMLDAVIRYPDHPLIRETKRECMEDYWDLEGLEYVLKGIRSGKIKVVDVKREEPSPMSLPFRRKAEASLLYEYNPTTTGIQRAAQEALKDLQSIKPAKDELARVSERRRLPSDEKALHSLLMMEGDVVTGELDLPYEWFESLSAAGRAIYIEPGLWIAAEHRDEYETALSQSHLKGNGEALSRIIRRSLRYRGPSEPGLTAERYFLSIESAGHILEGLKENGEAVFDNGLYYHTDIYERAVRETISIRRRQAVTEPPERYAALLSAKTRVHAPADNQLAYAIESLEAQAFPALNWENALLPSRVNQYRPAMLDSFLAKGEYFWRLEPNGRVSFHRQDSIDWDFDMTAEAESLESDELTVFKTLLQRGASFTSGLANLVQGRPIHDTLLNLAEKGLIRSDSFIPVRQLLERPKHEKATARRRVGARVMTLTSGRWDVSRPVMPLNTDMMIDRAFGKQIILCRETAKALNMPWDVLLERLRMMEYTGAARRGYFIEGFSGAQYIRDKDYNIVTAGLSEPTDDLIWLHAGDPAQAWGNLLGHLPGRQFQIVTGTAVCLMGGLPAAVLERQGQSLRLFNYEGHETVIKKLSEDYLGRRLFPNLQKLSVKQYPPEAEEPLKSAGFVKIMEDYCLYGQFI